MRTRSTPALATMAAITAFCLSVVTAATVTMSDAPGARQDSTVATVSSAVRDRFSIGATAPLQGQTSDFDGGGGWATDGGPTWDTFTGGSPSNDWISHASDYALRPTGGSGSAALVRWLTLGTTTGLRMRSLSTNSAGGIVMGADPTASSGLVAAGYRNGSQYEFAIFIVTGPSSLAYCSTPVSIGSNAGNRWTIQMTFDPSAAGVATAQLVRSGGGGGTFSVASTCSTAGASGSYAGMYSVTADNTRYDNFSAAL